MTIGENTRISSKARLDFANPKGVHIGDHTNITFDVAILAHDFINRKHVDTHIGSYCFVGARTTILPGITIGDHCIIGAGSVVMNDIPERSLAVGNPARVLRSNIMTGEYGSLLPAPVDVVPKSELPRELAKKARPNLAVIEVLHREIQGLDECRLNSAIDDTGIDSFEFITLRSALETRFGTAIPDSEWGSINALADITLLPSLQAKNSYVQKKTAVQLPEQADPRAGTTSGQNLQQSAHPGISHRTYSVGMPQMALSGLSESWLFKELGDIQWDMITKFLQSPSSALTDETGDRLYATFTRIRLEVNPSMQGFTENADLHISSSLRRYGGSFFFGEHNVETPSASCRATSMSTFAKYGERGKNTSLIKGAPTITDPVSIPSEAEFPAFGMEYRQRRSELPDGSIFECEYEILPVHDINGVGLLYFAAYPMIFDICIGQFEGKGFLLHHSTTEKDICYFANSEPTETLIFKLHERTEDENIVHHVASLSRKSDGERMAEVISLKSKLQQRTFRTDQ